MRFSLVYLLLFISSEQISSFVSRLPCEHYANFTKSTDTYYEGRIMETLTNITTNKCVLTCLLKEKCVSVNYNADMNLKCELISTLGGNTRTSNGWIHLTSHNKLLNVGRECNILKPCPAGRECIKSCNPPYYKCEDLYIIRHSVGLCIDIRNDGYLYLTDTCTTKFRYKADGKLMDESSTYCFQGDHRRNRGASIKRTVNCDSDEAYFYADKINSNDQFVLQHIATLRCIHPVGGSNWPRDGTPLLFWDSCTNTRKALLYKFEVAN